MASTRLQPLKSASADFVRGRSLLAPIVAAGLAICCGWLLVDRSPLAAGPLPLAVFGVAYILSERPVFHAEGGELGRRAPQSLVMATGLLTLSPIELSVTATLAAAIGAAVWNRASVLEVARTMASVGLETLVAALILDVSGVFGTGPFLTWVRLCAGLVLASMVGSGLDAIDALGRGNVGQLMPDRDQLRQFHLRVAPAIVASSVAVIVATDLRLGAVAALPVPLVWAAMRSHDLLRHRYDDLSNIHDFSREVSSESDLPSIAHAAAARIVNSTGAEHVLVRLFEADTDPVDSSIGRFDLMVPTDPADADGTWARFFHANELVQLTGLAREPDAGHAVLAMPIADDREVLGVVVASDRRGGISRFDDEDRDRIQTLCRQLAVVTRRSRLHARIRHDATHDRLTGLVNRRYFESWVDRALEDEQPGAVFLIDLDRFKEINDTFGHDAGDKVLAEGARRIQSVIRETDVAARLGGDEFALFVPTDDEGTALRVAEVMTRRLEEAFDIGPADVGIGASVGVAFAPRHGERAGELLRKADIAMYDAKRNRKTATVYTDTLEEGDETRLTLLAELRSVLAEEGLEVHYQPQIDLRTARVIGVEALVRWRHPIKGWVRPDHFVALAEQAGLIETLTRQVLRTAASDAMTWSALGWDGRLSVNLSAQSLLDRQLDTMILGELSASGLAPQRLTLEITETTMMGDPDRTDEMLRKLNDWGMHIAVDDFGTGYSSLVALQTMPVAELKIDKSFVMDMLDHTHNDTIVRSTIDLAHNLGLSVVAEGVETPAIAARLASLGCDVAQGFGIGKPMPAVDLARWIHDWYQRGTEPAPASATAP